MAPNTPGNNSTEHSEKSETQKPESSSLLTKLYKDFANELTNAEGLTSEQKTANIDNFMTLSTLS
jgi:hypothetical protein